MVEYREAMEKYAPRANPNDAFHVFGWASAQTMVEALKGMEEPTREALMESVRSLSLEQPILLPGIEVETGEGDGYPIEAMQVIEFNGDYWELKGDVVEAKR
jgi:branched-chain amino acid transport system substrate-binding protein